MRTERPTPWGFDVWDPRLELRRAAADAQVYQPAEAEEPTGEDLAITREPDETDERVLEPVGAATAR